MKTDAIDVIKSLTKATTKITALFMTELQNRIAGETNSSLIITILKKYGTNYTTSSTYSLPIADQRRLNRVTTFIHTTIVTDTIEN